jgi:hypothetical protein
MNAADFWSAIQPSGLTAEQELVAFWSRMRDCPCAAQEQRLIGAGGGATGIGGQVSLSEWLRRYGPQPQPEEVALAEVIDQAQAARDAKRKRRKREEVLFLLLLS